MRKMNILIIFPILLASVLLSGGCRKAVEAPVTEADEPKPQVNFTIGSATQKDPFTFSFKGMATNFKELIWSFGDGTTSYGPEVSHTYLLPGTYKVIAKAINNLGYWAQQEGQVTIRAQDIVNFTATAQANGSLKLESAMAADVQDFSWYLGNAATGLPISITPSASIPMFSTNSNFTYITLKVKTPNGAEAIYSSIVTNAGVLKDITDKGPALTVSNDDPTGARAVEGSLKLIDGLYTTKFLIYSGYSSEFWAQQKFTNSIAVNAYILVSGNDSKDRDPKTWDFVGSQDGITWVTLDSRKDIISDVRTETRVYLFNNTTAYNYYRINIKAIRGGSALQISEWRLMSTL